MNHRRGEGPRGGRGFRPTRHLRAWMMILALWVGACGRSVSEPPAPPSVLADVVRRHFDQVCRDSGGVGQWVRIQEIFDTAGLGAQLDGVGLTQAQRAEGPARVDFVSRYSADGSLQAFGVWDFTGDTAQAVAAAELVRPRVLPLGRLLAPVGVRSRLTLARAPRLDLAAPVECFPHMVHRPGQRPEGLPDSVTTWAGGASIFAGDDSTAVVTLRFGQSGAVAGVEREQGSARAFAATESLVAGLRFDPGLWNGESVEGTLRQSFRFRRRAELSGALADSLFLASRGFDLRRDAFNAILRVTPPTGSPTAASGWLGTVEGVRIEDDGGAKRAFLAGGGCPARVYLNGAPIFEEGGRTPASLDATGPGELTALELYAPAEGPVTDSLSCGTLLLWSRSNPTSVRLLGGIQGKLLLDTDVKGGLWVVGIEPFGRRTRVFRGGRYQIGGLLPGRYHLRIEHDGDVLWRGTVIVRAGSSQVLDLPPGEAHPPAKRPGSG